ncbi:MAG: hypothetical protein IT166_09515 [Bryobacterales bacterium]|nr:hypothetical protein [Bryobacterales bacterium]
MKSGSSAGRTMRETVLRKWIFWEFKRGSRPYDLVVALILAFIFITPREWFRDQPRASSVVMLPSEKGVARLWIEPNLLAGLNEDQRLEQARELLRSRTGKPGKLTRLEAIYDSEQDIRGFLAYATE